MKLTFLLLVLCALLPATSGWALFGSFKWPFTWGWGLGSYYRGQCTCTSSRISLDDKMALVAEDNDHNKDGLVTFDDFDYDIKEHFDKNHDGLLSEGECVERFRCRYGDTEQVAQYVCATIMQGEALTNISLYNREPFITGIPLDQFVAGNRARYELFFTSGCINRDITVEEKVALNARNNDYTGDGVVTSQDIQYDLTTFYDQNKDGRTSKAEFVVRWGCNYADRGDIARFLWNRFTQGADSIPNNYVFGPQFEAGVPIETYKANSRQNYEDFRNSDASAYIQYRP